jgi:MFS family permease
MFYISFGCTYLEGPTAWRVPWGLQMIPAVILFFGLMFLPESPRWLARHDRWEECHQVLTLVHGKGDPNAPFVQLELDEIKQMIEFENQNADVTVWELFKPRMLNRLHIGIFTQIWSQLTGMNVMMYYVSHVIQLPLPLSIVQRLTQCQITYVFGMAGLQGNNNLVASSIQYVINVVMTIFALVYIDRWGRRAPLVIGATLMATWMFANAGLMASYGSPAPEGGLDHIAEQSWQITGAPAKAVIACTYLFVASYAPTWGPVSWIYPPELFPLRVRGKAVALTTSSNWIFNFALVSYSLPLSILLFITPLLTRCSQSYFVPPAFVNIQWKVYLIFGVFCATMALHTFFVFPETAGKSLEDIEEMFLAGVPAWKTRVEYTSSKRAEAGDFNDKEKALGVEASPERVENATKV